MRTAGWRASPCLPFGAETIFFSLFRTLFRPKCHLLVSENLQSLTALPLSYFIFNLISYLWAKPGPDHNGRLERRGTLMFISAAECLE